jgi:hypothetical protein
VAVEISKAQVDSCSTAGRIEDDDKSKARSEHTFLCLFRNIKADRMKTV